MSLGDLVLSLADCKQMLGLRYAEWATRAPSLEADIAAAAMGLDDLGHSRVLYGCLEALGDDPRAADRAADPSSYRCVPMLDRPWESWASFVAANAILDTAFTAVISALADGDVEVLRTRLRKMVTEERFHFLHGRSWLREQGGREGPEVAQAWAEVVAWLGPEDGDLAELHRRGAIAAGPRELARRVAERLEQPLPEVSVDWSRWDPVRRRTEPGALDDRTFAMLRGLEERKFMPAGARSPG